MYKFILILILLAGCSSEKTELSDHRLDSFTLERYLGEWQEVERIDNTFERGLIDVTANYSIDENGRIIVVNKGFNPEKNTYKEARGYIKSTDKLGWFKVSFFRPFYGDYIVLDIDNDYKHALVGGGSSEYLWILSRDGKISKGLRDKFIKKARAMGYSYDKLKKY